MSSGRCQTDIVKHRPTRTLSPVTATTSSQSINQSINESIDESIDESINQTKHMDIALYVANESEAQSPAVKSRMLMTLTCVFVG